MVTFGAFTERRTLDRKGFGEGFLRSRQVDAIHVINRQNAWYQHAETLAAMEQVRGAALPYGRVVTYGSSMGAYAAIRLAGLAGAHCALALSPQFSIHPGTVSWEYRWAAVGQSLPLVVEGSLPLPDLPEAYVVYDPLNLDAQHAALLETGRRFTPVRLRGAGHPVTGFLLEVGLLQDLVLTVASGPLDAAAFEREAWRRRRRSPQRLVWMAARARPLAWRVALLRQAAALAPTHAGILGRLGLALGQAGRFAEARTAHQAALALLPGNPNALAELSVTLEAEGDGRGALAALEEAASRAGEGLYDMRLRQLRSRQRPAGPGKAGRTPVRNYDPPEAPTPGAKPILTEAGQRGFALVGPYRELRPGRYTVEFQVAAQQARFPLLLDRMMLGRRTACVLDVSIHGGRTVLARRTLTVAALRTGDGRHTLAFTMPEWTACEFRLFTSGATGLVIQPARRWRRVAG